MTAAIIYKKRILLLKRPNLPIVINPGIWGFLSGGRKKERYLATAYREIREESSIPRSSLKPLGSFNVMVTDMKHSEMWPNRFYIFRSSTDKVKLDYENAAYRWGTINQIEKEINYTNVFINEKYILRMIKRHVNGKNSAEKDK